MSEQPLMIEDQRLANLIELGVNTHPNQEKVKRWVREGASFVVRTVDGQLEIGMEFTDEVDVLAIMRADAAGAEREPQTEPHGAHMLLIRAPISSIHRKPQG